jgi:magnesium transporter
MLKELLAPEIAELIAARRWTELREVLEDWPAPEIADLLLDLPKADRVLLYRALSRRDAAETFSYLDVDQQDALLMELSDEETRGLLADLPPDDRTHLLEELPGQATQRLLNLLGAGDRREATWLLGYPEESVGRLMTPDYVAVRPGWTVEQALRHLRARGPRSETVNVVYVVDERWKLLDDIELRRLILAEPETPVADVMDDSVTSIHAAAEREEAVNLIRRYDLLALPVVDSDGVLLGIVTVDDVMDVAEEEATEDFHRVGSVGPIRTSVRDAAILFLYRRRIGWLLTLVFVNIFSSAGLAAYESTLAATLSLVYFLPLLIGSGGNAGSQSATLMVRAMATGDVEPGDWLRMVGKELGVALLMGLTMAAGVAAISALRAPEVMLVVALTMTISVMFGSLLGLSLPFVLDRLRLDPATASAPLVTSLADIAGVLIYMAIATWLLGT